MDAYLNKKIKNIVGEKLSGNEIEKLVDFFRYALAEGIEQDEDRFFKDLAYEMSGSVKDLAVLIINFRKDLKAKIHPDITDLTTKYIPQAADQLEGIIETTELAANKIMDNLEIMQERTDTLNGVIASFRSGCIVVEGAPETPEGIKVDPQTIQEMTPLVDHIDTTIRKYSEIISEIFVQMSFQDLTGQRIKRIMTLVKEMESRLKKMVLSFGIKIAEKEKNPDATVQEINQMVEERVSDLAGPQKAGEGLGQDDIDALLASI